MSGHCCRQIAKFDTCKRGGAHERQEFCPGPVQDLHDWWHGQQIPLWFGKLRGGHTLTQTLEKNI